MWKKKIDRKTSAEHKCPTHAPVSSVSTRMDRTAVVPTATPPPMTASGPGCEPWPWSEAWQRSMGLDTVRSDGQHLGGIVSVGTH